MNHPLVTVILAVYNRTNYLSEAIESVLGQTYSNIELIVVDDGSTIDLSGVLDQYKDKITLITHDNNRGLSAAINTGLRQASGEFIDILSDDDGYFPRKIERQLKIFQQSPEIDIVHTDYRQLKDGQLVGHSRKKQIDLNRKRSDNNLYYTLLRGNFIDAISPLVRKKCYDVIGGNDERLKNLEDWDMWIRMVAGGFKFYYLDEPTVYFRKHDDNKSKDPLRNMHQRFRVLYNAFVKELSPLSKDSKEWKTVRRKAYANVFIDYASSIYRSDNYGDYVKYMGWGLKLDLSRATAKIIRRFIKSYFMTMVSSRNNQLTKESA